MNFEKHSLSDDDYKSTHHIGLFIVFGIFGILMITGIFSIVKISLAATHIIQNVDSPTEIVFEFGTELKKDDQNRTNILLLGGGGDAHDEGSDLTDTLIVGSLDHETGQIYMISVPRDLFIKIPGSDYYRVNTLWPIGKANSEPGYEADLAKSAFKTILGLDIHYYAKIDFVGFEKVIDAMGGVDVVVDRTFTDYEYPDNNYGYMTVSFEAGPQHFDGEEALQFARSRHGNNNESGDFARAERQQKIIRAVKNRAMSLGWFGDPEELEVVINTVNEHYMTDITFAEILTFLKYAKKLDDGMIHNLVLKEGPGELLYVPTEEVRNQLYGGAYVLLPDGDDFSIIHKNVERFLNEPQMILSGPTVEVLNGTKTPNLAHYVATELMRNEIRIFSDYGIRNSYYRTGYETTMIYDHSRGGNIELAKKIQEVIGGEIVAENPEPYQYPVDVTVIIGDDFPIPEDLDTILGREVHIDVEDYELFEETTGDSTDSL